MGADKHDLSYYGKCVVGGALACGLTHAAVTPLDLVKCRKQANPKIYPGVLAGLRTIYAAEGTAGIFYGWYPTLIGYSLQGMGKFGFYELFKDVYAGIVGQDNAAKYKKIGWSISSASAEIIADTLLCPFETVKVRMQTTLPPNPSPSYAEASADIKARNATFKILPALWSRQVPYTVVKFVFFEMAVEWYYKNIWTKPKNEYSKATQLFVTFLSGYTAGIFCAIVSHPADTMVSKINSHPESATKGAGAVAGMIYKDIGFKGLWTGLGTRIFMIGTLTGLQWWIYDTFKTAVGLQTSGGSTAPVAAKTEEHTQKH